MAKRPALDHVRCLNTCWKGDPDDSLAPKARCIYPKGHPESTCLDENGNHFIGSGADAKVVVVR